MKSENRLIHRLGKETGGAIYRYKLFEQGDRVLIGLSGGKDSLALVDLLADWNRRSPVKVELAAAHIVLNGLGYSADTGPLRGFCEERGVEFYERTMEIDFEREPGTDKCFVCAWHRRKALFDLAKELSCRKLAFGHHMDDMIITLFMNMSFQGNISTMPAKVVMFKGDLSIVRPLARIEEKDIVRYAELKNLPVQQYACPHGADQSRAKIRGILDQLAALEPRVKRNIFNSMSNIRQEYLS